MANSEKMMLNRLLFILPLIVFVGLAAVFYYQFSNGTSQNLPSALKDKAAPDITLPRLLFDNDKTQSITKTFPNNNNKITLVNFWASWCVPCRAEAPLMAKLAQDKDIDIIGINYKDKRKAALQFLQELGNPYSLILIDANGRTAIDWGVYGIPETFIIDRTGLIRFRLPGPVINENFNALISPVIEKLRQQAAD